MNALAQESLLAPGDGGPFESFGTDVAVYGDYAIVAAGGINAAYIYYFDGLQWVQQQKLIASDGDNFDSFGSSVAISDSFAVVGASHHDVEASDTGATYVFKRIGTSWTEYQKLIASDKFENGIFGVSASISETTLLVGANGSAYVFNYDGTNWVESQKLVGSGVISSDQFGLDLSVSNSTAAVAAQRENNGGTDLGSVYIFTRNGGTWALEQKLTAADVENGDGFGGSVAVSDTHLLVGQNQADGSAFVFERNGSNWEMQQKLLDLEPASQPVPYEVSIYNDWAIVGTMFTDGWSGSARTFYFNGTDWQLVDTLLVPGTSVLGFSVSIGSSNFVVGAPLTPINGEESGAAYAYALPSNVIAWTNSQGGDFGDGSNWSIDAAPDQNQIALFDSSFYATATTSSNKSIEPLAISFSSITTNEGLTIGDAQVRFDLQAHSYGVNTLRFTGSGSLPDDSQLEIINGALGVTNPVGIGTGGFAGQLLVSAGGILEVNSDPTGPVALTIGSGDCGGGECGRISIQNGGSVNTNSGGVSIGSSDGSGSAFLTGEASEWIDSSLLTVGRSGGTGVFEVKDAATFRGKLLYAGFEENAVGSVTVDGSESLFTLSNALFVGAGPSTQGNLTVSAGALATIDSLVSVGSAGGAGEILVTGSGSTLLALDTTFVGNTGSGGVSVLDGGSMSSGTGIIAGTTQGIGSAIVDGLSSSWTVAGTLSIGLEGVGFARVTDNGTLVANEIEVGPLGSIEASGGTLIVGGTVITTPDLSISTDLATAAINNKKTSGTIQTNTLALSDGAEIFADSVVFEDGGSLRADGVFPFDVVNSGGVNPGNKVGSTGLLTIGGDYSQLTSGALFIELNGDVAGSGFDQLVVNGDVHLEGTLNVSVLDGYEPEVGQVYEFLIGQNVSGIFDSIVSETGVVVSVAYLGDRVTLEIISFVNVGVDNAEQLSDFLLQQNYPNPVFHSTEIPFRLRERAAVKLSVYNSLGQVVAVLINRTMEAGSHTVTWQTENEASGIYFYKLATRSSFEQSRKMIVVR